MIISCVETPVPIPNTTVKRAAADGTMSQGMGEYVVASPYEAFSLPEFYKNPADFFQQGFLLSGILLCWAAFLEILSSHPHVASATLRFCGKTSRASASAQRKNSIYYYNGT